MNNIKIPRESANDDLVKLVELNFDNLSYVSKGDVVASVEGEKSIYEIESDFDGYILYLYQLNSDVKVDLDFAIIFDNDNININDYLNKHSENISDVSESLDKTQVNLQESIVPYRNSNNKVKRIAVIGAGMGLSQIVEASFGIIDSEIVCAYDDTLFGKCLVSEDNIPIVGKIDITNIISDYRNGLFDHIVISISTNIKFRKELFNTLNKYIPFANIIHKKAHLAKNCKIGFGNIILSNTTISSNATIGDNCFISSYCNIEHHCKVGNNCTFGPGVLFSGCVEVNNDIKFGTGIFVEPKVIVTKSFVKSGSILKRDL